MRQRAGKARALVTGEKSLENVGRLGGVVTRVRYGSEHYRRIGQLGGRRTLAEHGVEHFRRAATLKKQPV